VRLSKYSGCASKRCVHVTIITSLLPKRCVHVTTVTLGVLAYTPLLWNVCNPHSHDKHASKRDLPSQAKDFERAGNNPLQILNAQSLLLLTVTKLTSERAIPGTCFLSTPPTKVSGPSHTKLPCLRNQLRNLYGKMIRILWLSMYLCTPPDQ
jgi:hypothetical protein